MDRRAVTAALTLRREGARVGPERIALLDAVEACGSLTLAAQRLGLSYKGAWDAAQSLNNLFDAPLIEARTGGARGGSAALTERGRRVLDAFRRLQAELDAVVGRLEAGLDREDLDDVFWSLGMRTSARNALKGTVARITDGAVNAEVVLQVAPGVEIVAVVTRPSVAELGLAVGRPAIALIKSSFVTLAVGEGLRTSARNQIPGRIASRTDGAVNSEIRLEIADGKTLTATITRESAEALGLKEGGAATALVKAQHVILALD